MTAKTKPKQNKRNEAKIVPHMMPNMENMTGTAKQSIMTLTGLGDPEKYPPSKMNMVWHTDMTRAAVACDTQLCTDRRHGMTYPKSSAKVRPA